MTVKIGSLFSGIGGFELGLERAIPGAVTIWQCEQNQFCQQVLKKHWPGAKIYDDVRNINETVEPVDILCGGFPCQDISVAGKQRGIYDSEKSSLWWEMHRIISILRPKIICLENVPNILTVGGCDVIASLAKIGYDCEWTVISASDFGAPHRRCRWFCVCWDTKGMSNSGQLTSNPHKIRVRTQDTVFPGGAAFDVSTVENVTHPNSGSIKEHPVRDIQLEKKIQSSGITGKDKGFRPNYWQRFPTQSPFHRRNDGVPHRVDRIRALGNAIVPQCSEWVGRQIIHSGLLNDLIGGEV